MTFAEELAKTAAASKRAALATALHDPHIKILRDLCQKAAEKGNTSTTVTIADLILRDGVKPNLQQLAGYARNELHMSVGCYPDHIYLDWSPAPTPR